MRRPLSVGGFAWLIAALCLVAFATSARAATWETISDADSSTSVEMPGKAEPTRQDGLAMYQLFTDNGESAFQYFVHTMPGELATDADVKGLLEKFRDNFISTINGKLLDEEAVEISGLKGVEHLVKMPNNVTLRQRCFPSGKFLLQQIVIIGPKSSIGPADITRYFGSLKAKAASVAGGGGSAPPTAPPEGWHMVREKAFIFAMPGAPEKETKEQEGGTYQQYSYMMDDGNTVFAIYMHPATISAADLKAEKHLEMLTENMKKTADYKLLEVKPIKLGNVAGREYLSQGKETTIHQRAFWLGNHLVQFATFTTEDSSVGPAIIKKFFNSIQLTDASGSPASTDDDVPNVSGSDASFSSFVDGVNAADATVLYGQMRKDLQEKVDPIVLQIFLDVVARELGGVAQKTTDDFSSTADDRNGQRTVPARGTVVFERGKASVRTTTINGKIVEFNISSPTLDPISPKMYAQINRYMNTPQSKQIGNALGMCCENFLEALYQGSERQAYETLHPSIQSNVAFDDIAGELTKCKNMGPVEDVELVTLGTEGATADTPAEIHLGFELKRPNKSPATAKFIVKLNGLQTMVTNFEISETTTLTDDAPAAPQTPSAPAAPAAPSAPVTPPPSTDDTPAPPGG